MNPLILTIAILTILSATTCGAVKRWVDRSHCHQLLKGGLEAARDARNGYEEQLYLIETTKRAKPIKSEGESIPKSTAKKRAESKSQKKRSWSPISTRLNLSPLLNEVKRESDGIEIGNESPYVAITAALMRQLYGKCDWFQEVPTVEYAIIETLQRQCKRNEHGVTLFGFRGELTLPDHLAAVPMEEEKVQQIWSKMVLGGATHPSLLDWVEMEKKSRKINLLLAPQQLLAAIFPNPSDVEMVVSARDSALDQFIEDLKVNPDEADANEVIEQMRTAVERASLPDRYAALVEYKVYNHPQQISVAGSDEKSGITAIYRFHTP